MFVLFVGTQKKTVKFDFTVTLFRAHLPSANMH